MKSKSLIHLLGQPLQVWKTARLTAKLPQNHPVEFLNRPRPSGKVVACLGDSITHGNVSYDWVSNLRARFSAQNLHFINAGINSNVVWQLNQRLPTILACRPDTVVVLIGTNDVMGSFHKADGQSYKRQGGLPAVPNQPAYRRELRKLLRGLQSVRHVAVATLPPLGENPRSPINRLVDSFNDDIRAIVAEENRTVLPLGERLFEILENRTQLPRENYQPGPIHRLVPIVRAVADYYIHNESWDQSASNRGLDLLPDHIHLGEKAGKVMADLVSEYIEQT